VCLLAVDVQNTFCTPGFELFVPGAPDDNRRLCEFVYRNLGAITEIVATLDTHVAAQVFHAAWLVDAEGRHPAPYTIVSSEDVETGVWRAADPAFQDHLLHYTRALEQQGRYRLTIWPYHALTGGIGHALVSAVEETFFFHAVARTTSPSFEIKGDNPLTEHYSALGPEITDGPAGEQIGARNELLIEHLLGFDAVAIAGQAKSHCVAWTIDDLLEHTPRLAERVYLLEDCTSPVVVPGVVDYTEQAGAAFARFAGAGMEIVTSAEPIDSWPGLG
jgi:nicotinamidase-related amidase